MTKMTETNESPIRVLLVEDEPLWQQGVSALLSSDSRFELAGVADRFEEAVALFEQVQPEFVLLDWKIRGGRDGLEVGQYFLSKGLPSERMILISGSEPGMIPEHPFLFVPKRRIAEELLPLMLSLTPH